MNRWLYVSLALTALALGAATYVYANRFTLLQKQVPTHWGIDGQPDRFTSRDDMLPHLLAFPGIMAVMIVMTVVLPQVSPKQFSIDTFRDTFNYLMMLVVGLFTYLDAVILTGYIHPEVDVAEGRRQWLRSRPRSGVVNSSTPAGRAVVAQGHPAQFDLAASGRQVRCPRRALDRRFAVDDLEHPVARGDRPLRHPHRHP